MSSARTGAAFSLYKSLRAHGMCSIVPFKNLPACVTLPSSARTLAPASRPLPLRSAIFYFRLTATVRLLRRTSSPSFRVRRAALTSVPGTFMTLPLDASGPVRLRNKNIPSSTQLGEICLTIGDYKWYWFLNLSEARFRLYRRRFLQVINSLFSIFQHLKDFWYI